MNSPIEFKLEILPTLGICLVAAGIVKQYLYYKCFKVRIMSFVSIDEVVISFADNLLSYSLILVTSIVASWLFIDRVTAQMITKATPVAFHERLLQYFNWPTFIVTLIFIVGVTAFGWARRNIFKYETILNISIVCFCLWILPILMLELQPAFNLPSSHNGDLFLSAAFIALMMYSIATAYSEAHKVKKRHYYCGSQFEIDSQGFVSTTDQYYIGQSKKFVFFYDQQQKCSYVVPIEKIKKYRFVR